MSKTLATSVDTLLKRAVGLADQALEHWLPGETVWPARLHSAMRYSVFAGGKRLRPALVLAAAEACGSTATAAGSAKADTLGAAMAAVELLHTYTLVHDDLPAMDDDDLRRGRPTCHKAYDEPTAILAGDALQTLAFEACAAVSARAVIDLAQAAGSQGVVGGQQEDLDAEGDPVEQTTACRDRLRRIHLNKTAALLRASCLLGAEAVHGSSADRAALATYGSELGLAFQIADDVLDATASAEVLGKTPGKDAAQGKLTWVALDGLDKARLAARHHADAAIAALAHFAERAEPLRQVAHFVVNRDR